MRWMVFALLSASCLRAQVSLEGTVVDAVSHQPMAGVHVILAPASSHDEVGRQIWGAISRKDGTFSIRELVPGTYVLDAKYNGYFPIPGKTPGGHDDAIVILKSGEEPKDVSIKMTPHAVIAGRVFDENGDPAPHVPVIAQPSDRGTYQANTDDRGQYRLPLPPGKYYVEAMAQGFGGLENMGALQEIRTDGSLPRVFGNTFYPSASGKENATPVELGPGQSANEIDIRLTSLVTTTISGNVTGMPPEDKSERPPAWISLSHITASGTFEPFMRSTTAGSDGKFTFAGVAPGRYRLVARSADLQSPTVEVSADNGAGATVILPLAHDETLRGTVRIEGDATQPATTEKRAVRLESHAPFGRTVTVEVAADGTFRVDQLFPGRFSFNVLPMPENAYIKSIKVGAAELPDGLVDLSSGINGSQVDIVISRNGGQIEGTVLDKDGKPWSAGRFAEVVLSRDDAGADPDFQQVDPGEKFTFKGLRPGNYRLIAVEPGQLPGRDGEALKSLLSKVPEIGIHEKDRISIDLKIADPENTDAK